MRTGSHNPPIVKGPVLANHADVSDCRFVEGLLNLALEQASREGSSLSAMLGLEEEEIDALLRLFPSKIASLLVHRCAKPVLNVGEEERALKGLLTLYSDRNDMFGKLLPAIFARRCQRPNHLWQDLGLQRRGDLRILMERYFSRLAARNRQDMKWKKFFYRQLCASADFGLCASPVCTDCDEYDDCFGSEEGRPLLKIRYGDAR